jgi:hypothetical protein
LLLLIQGSNSGQSALLSPLFLVHRFRRFPSGIKVFPILSHASFPRQLPTRNLLKSNAV